MRTMLKATMDVAASNKTIRDGSLGKTIQSVMEKIRPEAAYFLANEGCRSCLMVFDMKDTSEIPSIAEPFFLEFNARVEFYPVMNAEDLQKGLEAWQKSQ